MGFFDRFKKSSDSKNFKYLDDLVHDGVKEIVLDSDVILSKGEESEYKDGIKLDGYNLVIDGNGHTIVIPKNFLKDLQTFFKLLL